MDGYAKNIKTSGEIFAQNVRRGNMDWVPISERLPEQNKH